MVPLAVAAAVLVAAGVPAGSLYLWEKEPLPLWIA
jgi:hypothetical protein